LVAPRREDGLALPTQQVSDVSLAGVFRGRPIPDMIPSGIAELDGPTVVGRVSTTARPKPAADVATTFSATAPCVWRH